MRVGVVGLGVMGSATAQHLAAAGHDLVGFDVDPVARARFDEIGASVDSAPRLASSCDVAMFWVPSVDAMAEAVDGFCDAGRTGQIVIEMGTLPLVAKRSGRSRLGEAGIRMLDAPVSGTGRQAADATLVVFGSGERSTYDEVAWLFDTLGTARYIGPFGHGSVMKYVANLLVTVHTLAAAEAHDLAARSGLDPMLVQEVIGSGVASSHMWDIRGAMMAAGVYEPPAGRLDIIKKDAGIIAEYADEVGAKVPSLDLALEWFTAASDAGLGSLDAAAIRRFLDER